jgi:hypothetical protein
MYHIQWLQETELFRGFTIYRLYYLLNKLYAGKSFTLVISSKASSRSSCILVDLRTSWRGKLKIHG